MRKKLFLVTWPNIQIWIERAEFFIGLINLIFGTSVLTSNIKYLQYFLFTFLMFAVNEHYYVTRVFVLDGKSLSDHD